MVGTYNNMTDEEALSFKLPFGKYNGQTIKRVLQLDEDYIFWLIGQEIRSEKLREALEKSVEWFELQDEFGYGI